MKKVILGCLISAALSACSVGWTVGDGLALAGSPEAIESFYEGQNAILTNGKSTDPLGNSAAWEARNLREQERTKRKVPPSFWAKLTNNVEKGS